MGGFLGVVGFFEGGRRGGWVGLSLLLLLFLLLLLLGMAGGIGGRGGLIGIEVQRV